MTDPIVRAAEADTIYYAILGDVTVGGGKLFHPHPGYRGHSPSFGLYSSTGRDGVKTTRWHCHRNDHGGDAWDLLKLMLGTKDFGRAARYFNERVADGDWLAPKEGLKRLPSPDPEFIWKSRPDDYDLAYFARLGVPQWKLKRDLMCYPRRVNFTEHTAFFSTITSPQYAWQVGKGLKLYRPYAESWAKHRNINLDPEWIDGIWNVAEQAERMYIVSSRKDRMIVDTRHAVINGTGGENNVSVWSKRASVLLGRAKKIFVLNDGDYAGWEGAQKIARAMDSPRVIALDTRGLYPPGCKDFGDVADKNTPRHAIAIMAKIDNYVKEQQ